MFYAVSVLIISIIYLINLLFKPDKKTEPSNPCLFSAEKKGKYEEDNVKAVLKMLPGEYEICTNVYLPKENGDTSETDIIFIHETGVYVVEAKYYSGKIGVDENNKEWVQYMGRNNSISNKFYSPIEQNKTHIKYLKKLLESRNIKVKNRNICSLIIFGESSDLDKEIFRDNLIVDTDGSLFFRMRDKFKISKRIFSKEDIENIYNVLKDYCDVCDEVKMKHIDDIKKKHNG